MNQTCLSKPSQRTVSLHSKRREVNSIQTIMPLLDEIKFAPNTCRTVVIPSFGQDIAKFDSHTHNSSNAKWYDQFGKQFEDSLLFKAFSKYIPKENFTPSYVLRNYYTSTQKTCIFFYSSLQL